jgi:predicted benzoate:H+ symporter BenE
MPAIAYFLLQMAIVHQQGNHSVLAHALGRHCQGKISVLLYAAAVALAFVDAWLSIAIYAPVAVMWLIPGRRIEKVLHEG